MLCSGLKMNKLWILLLAICAVNCVAAQYDDAGGAAVFPDYWQNDDWNLYDDNEEKLLPENVEEPEMADENQQAIEEPLPEPELEPEPIYPDNVNNDDTEKEVLEEIDDFRKHIDNSDQNVDPNLKPFDDYQFEDNRSKEGNNEEGEIDRNDENEESIPDLAQNRDIESDDQNIFDDTGVLVNQDDSDGDSNQFNNDQVEENSSQQINNEDSIVDTNDDNEESIPDVAQDDTNAENNQNIFDKTQILLNQFNTNEENEESIPNGDTAQVEVLDENGQRVFEETRALLNEDSSNNDDDDDDDDDDQFDDIVENTNDNENVYIPNDRDDAIEPELSFQQLDEILNKIDEESKQSLNDYGPDLNQEEAETNQQIFDETQDILNNSDGNVDEAIPDIEDTNMAENNNENEGIVYDTQELSDEDDASDIFAHIYDEVLNNESNEKANADEVMSPHDQELVDDVGRFSEFVPDVNEDAEIGENKNESDQNDEVNYGDAPLVPEEQQNAKINDIGDQERNDQEADDTNDDSSDEYDEYDTDKIFDDLDDDLKQLFETWDKLSKPVSEENQDEVQKYESENEKPYREESVLSQRQDEDLAPPQEDEDDVVPLLGANDNDNGIIDMINDKTIKSSTIKTIEVEDLSPSQYDDLMKQFSLVHADELDTQAEEFERHVAPIHIKLSVDEPTVVTSPNYPNAYPTNNIVDWIFDGEGTGIEFNVTDLALNGALGDYLLVKPGGEDETGTDGLLFSYTLCEPRQYRFFDIDRMFVRFEAKMGLAFNRGFQFSVRMIDSLPEDPEPEPEPEPLLPTPTSTMTVSLGGVSAHEFLNIKEDFRKLIADMATLYINANYIELGVNTTSETTQITSTALCNVNWPGFESCVQVTFGVPLVYEDDRPARLNSDDLHNMWTTYVTEDPFAQRLKRMGIEEFAVPDDSHVLMVWLVIGAGVLISAAMLALALWRFSCFEDYTRMPAFSDTDSIINEKRALDLYPTPHQTLPPLYGDPDFKDFKWEEKFDDSTRVDMGGYANKTFTRDELYDIDSDEDNIINTRDRSSITPRDI